MESESKTWTRDKIDFFARHWASEGEAEALLFIVPGMGEHSGRYDGMATFMNAKQVEVWAYDQRGHGKSGGKRGHMPRFESLLDDLDFALQECLGKKPHLPLFILGHSMGGNVVLNYALRRQPKVKGVIGSSPYLELAFKPSATQVTLGKMMSSIYPKFSQSTNLEVEALSRDPQVIEAYQADPLVHDKITASFFVEIEKSAAWALENGGNLHIPALLYHGTEDRLTDWKGSERFAQKSELAAFKKWEGLYHEPHLEPEKEEVLNYLYDWMQSKI